MKKKMLLFCCMGIAMLSCQTTDVISDEDTGKVDLPVEKANEFILVSDEVVEESDALELRSSSYVSNYEQSMPIYRYYYHGGEKSDHYYGTEAPSGDTRNIKNRTYGYNSQEFNLEKNASELGYVGRSALYRYYSSSLNDHTLSASSVSGYAQDGGALGYIFTSQEMGTVALKEYYSSVYKNHFITRDSEAEYIPANEPTYQYVKTIGYVYPGARNFSNQTPFSITIKCTEQWTRIPFEAKLNIRIRDANNIYRDLLYTGSFQGIEGEAYNVTLPNNCKIVSADLIVVSKIGSTQYSNTFYNISRPGFPYYGGYYGGGEDMQIVSGARLIYIDKKLNGYNTIFNIFYGIMLGNG